MRRDQRLIRDILRFTEERATGEFPLRAGDFLRWTDCYKDESTRVVQYHIGLCRQAGFIDARKTGGKRHPRHMIYSLTWKGHEHLSDE